MIALIVIGAFLLSFLISHCIVIWVIFKNFYVRFKQDVFDKRIKNDPNYAPYIDEILEKRKELESREHKILSVTSNDGLCLKGRYYEQGSKDLIIFFHGVHVNSLNTFAVVATAALEKGYNVLIVDQRAHGLSDGKYITYGKKEHEDILKWIELFDDNNQIENIYLFGASMGGTSVALASEKITSKKVKALIIDSAYCTLRGLINHIIASQKVPSFLFLSSITFLAKHLAKVGLDDFDTKASLSKNKIPSLFVYGTADIVVTKDFFVDNYNACASSKEELVVENAPHILAFSFDREALTKMFNFIKENK